MCFIIYQTSISSDDTDRSGPPETRSEPPETCNQTFSDVLLTKQFNESIRLIDGGNVPSSLQKHKPSVLMQIVTPGFCVVLMQIMTPGLCVVLMQTLSVCLKKKLVDRLLRMMEDRTFKSSYLRKTRRHHFIK